MPDYCMTLSHVIVVTAVLFKDLTDCSISMFCFLFLKGGSKGTPVPTTRYNDSGLVFRGGQCVLIKTLS